MEVPRPTIKERYDTIRRTKQRSREGFEVTEILLVPIGEEMRVIRIVPDDIRKPWLVLENVRPPSGYSSITKAWNSIRVTGLPPIADIGEITITIKTKAEVNDVQI